MRQSKKRAKKLREARELASALRRFSRALVKRAGEGDLEALEALMQAKQAMDVAVGEAARALNQPCIYVGGTKVGYSWSDIGAAVGISRQQAHRQWSTPTTKALNS